MLNDKDKEILVVFTGWGFNKNIWSELVEGLQDDYRIVYSDSYDLKNLKKTGKDMYVIGWSKGGMEAIEFACKNPDRVSKAILISTTAKFTQDQGYKLGWKKRVLERMKSTIDENPKSVLAEFTKNMLSVNDRKNREIITFLQELDKYYIRECQLLKEGLDYLIEADIRDKLSEFNTETLLIHGEEDKIVDIGASEYIEKLSAGAVELDRVKGVGHIPFHSRKDYCLSKIKSFLGGQNYDR